MHSRPFQPCLHHYLVGALYQSAPNRPARSLKPRILHLRNALLQIRQVLTYHFNALVPCCQAAQAFKYLLNTLVLEVVELPLLPGAQTGMLCSQQRFANLANPLCRVRKIQNARGIGRLKIDEALNPFRSITHARKLRSCLDASAVELAQCEALKQLGFRYPREVGMRVCRDNFFSIDDLGLSHFAYNQGFDFGPFAMHERHKGAIQAQNEFVWPLLDLWPVALNTIDFSQLHSLIGQANRFGEALGS